jgi:prolyl-tRNA editing enzyme YbaK/EbsC (Cys-tRNA(Pro) deacylase)
MFSMTQQVAELEPSVVACLEKYGIEYKVLYCDPELADTAKFCEHYGYELAHASNAIVVATKSEPIEFACCMVLATTKLDVNKKVRQIMDGRKVSFATPEQTKELTGMLIGGVTPFGLQSIPLLIDAAVMQQPQVIAGGGNRSTKVLLNPEEYRKLPNAQIVEGLAVPR